jgi:hypothetical protein
MSFEMFLGLNLEGEGFLPFQNGDHCQNLNQISCRLSSKKWGLADWLTSYLSVGDGNIGKVIDSYNKVQQF